MLLLGLAQVHPLLSHIRLEAASLHPARFLEATEVLTGSLPFWNATLPGSFPGPHFVLCSRLGMRSVVQLRLLSPTTLDLPCC